MKKSLLYSIIAIMMFIFICMICAWEIYSFEEKKDAEPPFIPSPPPLP